MRKRITHIFLMVFLVFLGSIVIFTINQFKIKKTYIISEKESIQGLEILNGQYIFFLDREKISQYLKQKNIEIKTVKINIVNPSSLIISLTYRQPLAIYSNNSERTSIDDEGVSITYKLENEKDLPLILAKGISLSNNKKIDWRVGKVLSLLKNLSKQGILVSRITISEKEQRFDILLSDGINVDIPQIKDITQIAASLQTIITRFRIEGKIISKVDYQFEKPIVELSN